MTYQESVYYLETLYNFDRLTPYTREQALPRMQQMLDRIGNPEKNMTFIHVGGTSGKGSIATMIHYILTDAHIKNGLYTSPHVSDTTERISLNTHTIPKKKFATYVETLKPVITTMFASPFERPSYTEIMFAIALLYFSDENCTHAIIEVGMGGRYDYTNVIPSPVVTVISNIGQDHEELLGKTYAERARAKAGIIKHGTTCITAENRRALRSIFKKICREQQATFIPLHEYIKKCAITQQGLQTSFLAPDSPRTFKLGLAGAHQIANACIAKKTTEILGVSKSHIAKGLQSVYIPARIETVAKNPQIIVDSAHNPQKMQALAKIIKNLTYKKLFLIIGITDGKNYRQMVTEIVSTTKKTDTILATRFKNYYKQALNPFKIQKHIQQKLGQKNCTVFLDSEDALSSAIKQAKPQDLIMITGSMYLAGELRKLIQNPKS